MTDQLTITTTTSSEENDDWPDIDSVNNNFDNTNWGDENWSNNSVSQEKSSRVCCSNIDDLYRGYDLCIEVLMKIASDATICPTVR